jgi:hypothetical protein
VPDGGILRLTKRSVAASRLAWPASILLLIAVGWLLAPRIAGMGGYDSYYYLLYARDLAGGMHDGLQARYFYFPGAYHFWRLVFAVTDGSYAECQYAFALVGLSNAALVILTARAAGCGIAVATLAGVAYLVIGQRLELDALTTEPIVTAPALLGLLGWVAAERMGRSRIGLAALGAGFGLGIFVKQQGVLLAAGLTGLLPGCGRDGQGLAQAARSIAAALLAMLAAFAVAMWLDGGGVLALRLALESALRYEPQGELLQNLAPIWRGTPLAALLCFAAIAGSALAMHPRGQRRSADSVRFTLVGICFFAAAATLIQFARRGYAHYALLTLPFALLAAAAAASLLRERLAAIVGRHATLSMSIGVATWLVLAALMLHAAADWARRKSLAPPQHDAYRPVCSALDKGERLLLLPSRENALHWACGTHAAGTAWGYTYNFQEAPEDYIEELRKPELRQVFVFRPASATSYEAKVLAGERWQPFFAALQERGFARSADFTQGTVYRRP